MPNVLILPNFSCLVATGLRTIQLLFFYYKSRVHMGKQLAHQLSDLEQFKSGKIGNIYSMCQLRVQVIYLINYVCSISGRQGLSFGPFQRQQRRPEPRLSRPRPNRLQQRRGRHQGAEQPSHGGSREQVGSSFGYLGRRTC
jgi:hypothetical protein